MSDPAVSVLMAARDERATIGRAIESILAQTFTHWELVVVDDGSRDGTGEVAASFGDPRIRVVGTAGVGLTRALNAGLRACAGALVARQDADDWSLPHRLALQVSFLQGAPGVVAVGGAWREVDPRGRPLRSRVAFVPGRVNETLHRFNPLAHTTVMFRRDAVEAVGCYDESLRFAQDYDLWLRLAAAGGSLWNLPAVVAVHTTSPFDTSSRYERRQMVDELRARVRHLRRSRAAGHPVARQLPPLARRALVLAAPLPLKRAVRSRQGKAP